jgi:iron complex outermembrane receptor protein
MTIRGRWQSTIAWPVLAVTLATALAPSPARAQTPLPVKIYAQELLDRTLAQHPELRTAAIYATPPKAASAAIVASNIGRIGKPAETADLEVISSGHPRVVAADASKRIEIELPLRDAAGQTIGALDLVWPCPAGKHCSGFENTAVAIRDSLARRILTLANLFEPFPYVPAATTRSRAQALIDDAVVRHPDVTVLALRAKIPPNNELVLLGSTFGRHGKPADADDMKVLDAPSPITGLYSNGKRFGVDLAMRDRSGAAIGTMNVGYAYRDGDDRKALEAKAVALRDEIQARIGDASTLGEIDP